MTDPDIIAQAEAFQKWMDAVKAADGKIDGEHVAYCDKCDIEEWLPHLLAEAKAWKAKAIKERAMERAYYEISEGGWRSWSAFQKHCPEETTQYLEQAARELAEEMRSEAKGDE